MQKGNERKNVVLLGFLKDLAAMKGNEQGRDSRAFSQMAAIFI
jgi:hypothetical protein